MQRVAWWEEPYPRRVQHPAASRSPVEVLGPSAASRSVAADVRPERTSSRSPKSRPRSCLPAEISFLRGFSTPTYARNQPSGPILSVATSSGSKLDSVEIRLAEMTDELSTNQSIDPYGNHGKSFEEKNFPVIKFHTANIITVSDDTVWCYFENASAMKCE